MVQAHILGYPRIDKQREMKKAVEAFWSKTIDETELLEQGKVIRERNWAVQKQAGLDFVTVNDFSWYDHMLDMASLLGVVPERYEFKGTEVDLDTYFRMARGRAPKGKDVVACEMTKWFDTNYHYIVPELTVGQTFPISSSKVFDEVNEAKSLGYNPKPVLVGPLTFLWLAKSKDEKLNKLELMDSLVESYQTILNRLSQQGVEWVQMDEPILALDLPKDWKEGFEKAYQALKASEPKLLLTTYFGSLDDNLELASQLAFDGLHLDKVRSQDSIARVLKALPKGAVLSLGVVDGRNIWASDLNQKLEELEPIKQQIQDRLWVGSSCSLLHSPVDVEQEQKMDDELKGWLAFAEQKVGEVATLKQALIDKTTVHDKLVQSAQRVEQRRSSSRIHNPKVQARMGAIADSMWQRKSAYKVRAQQQKKALNLPLLPTTTIGSFPQTKEIRSLRRDWKKGELGEQEYKAKIQLQIQEAVKIQEDIGLDVLVHGEAERNDMVEYFGELLDGYAFTEHGWVQSYGSRCVKPPIIYGDVSRRQPMTVEWTQYAQSLTKKHMKGMLTGPVTMLFWSFVRDDQPRSETANQIALALRDELIDLEKANIRVIQLDEPAFREGLPLRHKDWMNYLEWSVRAFRLATSGVCDSTQIHTHMCYSEFNDVIESIAALDADVITIETSRSQMELLDAFKDFKYPNEIGPGVYDIHSPRVPSVDEMVNLMEHAQKRLPLERLWVNPDCGLKTRGWSETKEALTHMVKAAQTLRARVNVQEPELVD